MVRERRRPAGAGMVRVAKRAVAPARSAAGTVRDGGSSSRTTEPTHPQTSGGGRFAPHTLGEIAVPAVRYYPRGLPEFYAVCVTVLPQFVEKAC